MFYLPGKKQGHEKKQNRCAKPMVVQPLRPIFHRLSIGTDPGLSRFKISVVPPAPTASAARSFTSAPANHRSSEFNRISFQLEPASSLPKAIPSPTIMHRCPST